jgi:hypothetical protein
MSFLKGIFAFVKVFLDKIMRFLFGKVLNPLGKLRFLRSPKQTKRFAIVFLTILGLGVLIFKLTEDGFKSSSGIDDYESELNNALGISADNIDNRGQLSDPLANYKFKRKKNAIYRTGKNKAILTAERCDSLVNKVKIGSYLSDDDKVDLEKCINENIMGLDENELRALRELVAESLLTDEEKNFLAELLKNNPACMRSFESTMNSLAGKDSLTKILQNPILTDPDRLSDILEEPETVESKVGLSFNDTKKFTELLNVCGADILKKLLSDPKYLDLIKKLLRNAPVNFDKLINDGLTDTEKSILKGLLLGDLDDNMTAVAEALIGSDPFKKDLAKKYLKARDDNNEGLASALLKKLLGDGISAEEEALIEQEEALLAAEIEKESSVTGLDRDTSGLTEEELARLLAEDLARIAARRAQLEKELAEAQARAAAAAAKFARGEKLTKEEQALLDRALQLQRELDALAALELEKQRQLAKLLDSLKGTYTKISKTLKAIYPTGIVIGSDIDLACPSVAPFKIVKIKKKKRKKPSYYDYYGKKLTPEQLRLLSLFRKNKKKEKAAEDEFLGKGFSSSNIAAADINTQDRSSLALKNGKSANGAGSAFLGGGENLKAFNLTPDMKIPGILMSRILVAESGSQTVKIKITRNVLDPATDKIVIPRGSIAIAKAGSFNAETGYMKLVTTKVSLGSGKVEDIALEVGSADNSPELKGEIYDARGKHIVGAYIASFSAGALAAISQSFINPLQESDLLQETLVGVGLSGGSEVANTIAETYAGDLQNAPNIFYAPSGIKVILTPQ